MTTNPPVGRAAPVGAAWPRHDLEARLVRVLDLAAAVVSDFGAHGRTDELVPELGFGPDKVVAESAMLAWAAAGCTTDAEVGSRVDRLVDLLVPLARSLRVLLDAALHPARAFKYAVPHVLLSRLGRPDPEFDAFLADACASARASAADVPPSARLERHWIAQAWPALSADGAEPDGPQRGPDRTLDPDLGRGQDQGLTWGPDLRQTALGRPLDVLDASREEVYALTHVLFYVSDLGHRSPTALPRPAVDVLADVEAALVRYVHGEDYDLAGELLMAWPELRAAWGPVAAFCFRVLADVEDAVGVLPCGNVDHARFAALPPGERERYARATGYHTAYVMGFLCASALRCGEPPLTLPSAGAPACATVDSAWPELLTLVDPERHWRRTFDTLTDAEKCSLTNMLADIAALEACSGHDYRRAAHVVALAEQAGVAGPMQARVAGRLSALGSAAGIASRAARPASSAGAQGRVEGTHELPDASATARSTGKAPEHLDHHR